MTLSAIRLGFVAQVAWRRPLDRGLLAKPMSVPQQPVFLTPMTSLLQNFRELPSGGPTIAITGEFGP